jgi:uncharacterized repeat protein (TIGR04138 family)
MQRPTFEQAVQQILAQDHRYQAEAYAFLREALDFTVRALQRPQAGPQRHVSGQELLQGIRSYALQEFGPIAGTVLRTWGIRGTEDFGNIVFNMVESGVLGKTDQDRREDFADGYDFDEAFVKPFLPPADQPAAHPRRTPGTPPQP